MNRVVSRGVFGYFGGNTRSQFTDQRFQRALGIQRPVVVREIGKRLPERFDLLVHGFGRFVNIS
jgi:hypothetical protein